MHWLLAVACILVFIQWLPGLNGQDSSGYTNTDDGFCKFEGSIRVPVGETGYNDKKCELLKCKRGFFSTLGCPDLPAPVSPENCMLVRREGHHPDCCPRYKCVNDED
ncbi:hypothetical protein TNIN_148421 [Trichonephila inaurata madagascariensis]|uniref:Single domain-containing protein n=1 Tax=Trichonephila inaurata madagascariensis TaxID=2747483 RepID=A0A8X6IBI5_9ARAC|nr:hypothetical protein TNIN_148421 [Trichonephila inaurata madagascariensis]